jgi:hypothetical protein
MVIFFVGGSPGNNNTSETVCGGLWFILIDIGRTYFYTVDGPLNLAGGIDILGVNIPVVLVFLITYLSIDGGLHCKGIKTALTPFAVILPGDNGAAAAVGCQPGIILAVRSSTKGHTIGSPLNGPADI